MNRFLEAGPLALVPLCVLLRREFVLLSDRLKCSYLNVFELHKDVSGLSSLCSGKEDKSVNRFSWCWSFGSLNYMRKDKLVLVSSEIERWSGVGASTSNFQESWQMSVLYCRSKCLCLTDLKPIRATIQTTSGERWKTGQPVWLFGRRYGVRATVSKGPTFFGRCTSIP